MCFTRCFIDKVSGNLKFMKSVFLTGVVVSQCADIGLAHLTYSQSKDDESYYDGSVNDADSDGDPTYFMILVRWLKSKVYIAQSTLALDSVDSDLDPQPGFTCHMTKWSRMDPLDPTKITLEEVFRNSQTKERCVTALFPSSKAPLATVAAVIEKNGIALGNRDRPSLRTSQFPSKYPPKFRGKPQSLPTNPNPVIACGRTLQTALDRRSVNFDIQSSDSPPFNVVNTCFLVWPMSPQLENSNGAIIESWQFPVDVLSFYGPTSGVFEGLLFPRLVISDLLSFSQLHHELAGIKEPSSSSPEPLPSDTMGSSSSQHVRDPRRPKEQHSDLSPCPPFVHVDRLREWTVPSKENAENDACKKPGQFAGYKGNYFLLTLPETSKQQEGVAKLFETLKTRKLACLIKMPCKDNAAFYIFPDSEFSRSIGIPPLSSSELTSFHGILLLPHSLFPTQLENCPCRHGYSPGTDSRCRQSTAPRETNWQCSTVQYVLGLPNRGETFRQKAVEYASTPSNDIQPREPIDADESLVFTQTSTPMSPQEPTSYDDAPTVVPIPDAPVLGVAVNSGQSPSASCDMELETSIDSTVPLSPVKSNNDLSNFNGCDASVPEIPIVPENGSSGSLPVHFDLGSTQIVHGPKESNDPKFNQIYFPNALSSSNQFLRPNSPNSDYNTWLKQKVRCHEASTPNITTSSPAVVALRPCAHPEVLVGSVFSPSSPDNGQVTLSRRFKSHNHSPEEEEGEIVDDDEGEGEFEDDSDSSSENNRSFYKSNRRHTSRDRHRKRSIRAATPPRRKRSRYDSSPHRRSPIKRRDRCLADVDYRTISRSEIDHGRSLISSKYSHAKPLKDTDYRYQVYIPKSEQKPSVPVKVIDYGCRSAESEAPQSQDKHLSRSYGRHNSSGTQSTIFSVPRHSHSRSLNAPNIYPNGSRSAMTSGLSSSVYQARPLLGYVPTTVRPFSYSSLKFSMQPNRTRLPLRLERGNSGMEPRFQLNNGGSM
ncbi:hypothetical protein Aperf_G00000043031 [Anoplocephala perfoliata]